MALRVALLGWMVAAPRSYALGPPAAPVEVRLEALSASTIGATWENPEVDGGAPILSYLVEWDPTPGNLEVRNSTFGSTPTI